MGLIRILLALSVVSGHSNPHILLKFCPGTIAVESFFMISGFYMAMVYKNYESKAKFWKSRFLRLYPAYIFCAFIAFLFTMEESYFNSFLKLPFIAKFFLIFTNLTIFFQDFTMFLGVNEGNVHFVKYFTNSSPPLHNFLLIPQAWSIGLEISFYLLVPWLLNTKKTLHLFVIVIISLLIRAVLQLRSFEGDPWSYRFLPSELSLFVIGSIMFIIHSEQKTVNETLDKALFVSLITAIILYPLVPIENELKKLFFYILLAVNLGKIFEITKQNSIDNFIGSLSYPVYCCHSLILSHLLPRIPYWSNDGKFITTLVSYIVIIIFSFIINFLIEKPIDNYRKKYKT